MLKLSTAEVRNNLSEAINKAVYGHEQVVITRRDKPIAAIISMEELKLLEELEEKADVLEAKAVLENDEFVEYEQARKESGL